MVDGPTREEFIAHSARLDTLEAVSDGLQRKVNDNFQARLVLGSEVAALTRRVKAVEDRFVSFTPSVEPPPAVEEPAEPSLWDLAFIGRRLFP